MLNTELGFEVLDLGLEGGFFGFGGRGRVAGGGDEDVFGGVLGADELEEVGGVAGFFEE